MRTKLENKIENLDPEILEELEEAWAKFYEQDYLQNR